MLNTMATLTCSRLSFKAQNFSKTLSTIYTPHHHRICSLMTFLLEGYKWKHDFLIRQSSPLYV